MKNKEFIEKYIEYKKDCIELNIIDLEEVCKTFEIKLKESANRLH